MELSAAPSGRAGTVRLIQRLWVIPLAGGQGGSACPCERAARQAGGSHLAPGRLCCLKQGCGTDKNLMDLRGHEGGDGRQFVYLGLERFRVTGRAARLHRDPAWASGHRSLARRSE